MSCLILFPLLFFPYSFSGDEGEFLISEEEYNFKNMSFLPIPLAIV